MFFFPSVGELFHHPCPLLKLRTTIQNSEVYKGFHSKSASFDLKNGKWYKTKMLTLSCITANLSIAHLSRQMCYLCSMRENRINPEREGALSFWSLSSDHRALNLCSRSSR